MKIHTDDFFNPAAIDSPEKLLAMLLNSGPVCQIGDTRAFWVGSFAAVEEAVKRNEDFSANLNGMLMCDENNQVSLFDLAAMGAANTVIANADEPDHAIHRKLMLPPLKANRIAELETELRDFAHQQIAECLHIAATEGEVNICPLLSEPLPAYVVMRLLGLNQDDLNNVTRWAMMGGDFLAGFLTPEKMDTVFNESAALHNFLSDHFRSVKALLGDENNMAGTNIEQSLTATLVQAVEQQMISEADAISIALVLFGAAGESTASLLGSAIRLLAEDLQLQQTLRQQPDLIANFIEECARLETPFKFHYRFVKQDTELCGTPLKQGDALLLGWASANRDPLVFEQANSIKLDRNKSQKHFAFGYGIHFCIGAPLARLEVRVALEELLSNTSTFRLAASDSSQNHVSQHSLSPKAWRYAPSIFVRRLEQLKLQLEA